MPNTKKKIELSSAELQRRRKFFAATVVTCIALVMILGGLHVVQLGSIRMSEMRGLATYNLKEESTHIRSAGEDIALHE